jgi:hypothetical protein
MSVSREISLRSLLGLPAVRVFLGAAVVSGVTLVVALLLPKVFESQASVVFSVSTQQVSSQQVTTQILASLPAPAALAQAFTQRLETRSVSDLLGEPVPIRNYDARFEEKRGLLTLRARGSSPEEARKRADKLLEIAQGYLQERIVAAARASVASSLEQARVDLKTGEQILHDIRDLLKASPKRGGNASAAVAAGLEALKVDPSVARSVNPAETFLGLQEAQLAAQVASARARTDALEGVLKDPEALSRLVGQALQVQVLAPPAEPVRAASPRPLLWTAIAFAASFSVGLMLIVIREPA